MVGNSMRALLAKTGSIRSLSSHNRQMVAPSGGSSPASSDASPEADPLMIQKQSASGRRSLNKKQGSMRSLLSKQGSMRSLLSRASSIRSILSNRSNIEDNDNDSCSEGTIPLGEDEDDYEDLLLEEEEERLEKQMEQQQQQQRKACSNKKNSCLKQGSLRSMLSRASSIRSLLSGGQDLSRPENEEEEEDLFGGEPQQTTIAIPCAIVVEEEQQETNEQAETTNNQEEKQDDLLLPTRKKYMPQMDRWDTGDECAARDRWTTGGSSHDSPLLNLRMSSHQHHQNMLDEDALDVWDNEDDVKSVFSDSSTEEGVESMLEDLELSVEDDRNDRNSRDSRQNEVALPSEAQQDQWIEQTLQARLPQHEVSEEEEIKKQRRLRRFSRIRKKQEQRRRSSPSSSSSRTSLMPRDEYLQLVGRKDSVHSCLLLIDE